MGGTGCVREAESRLSKADIYNINRTSWDGAKENWLLVLTAGHKGVAGGYSSTGDNTRHDGQHQG